MYESEATNEIAAALARAQSEMKPAAFNRVNPGYKNKYADLTAIIESIKGPLTKNGIGFTQQTQLRDGAFIVRTTLRHPSGQWIASDYPLPATLEKPQVVGSALTYAKRYSLASLVGMSAEEDDDANAASEPAKSSTIKPVAVEAPVDPETGEVTPHRIKAPNEVSFASLLIAAVNMAESEAAIDQWLLDNKAALETLESIGPKLHQNVRNAVTTKRKSFKKDAA